MKLTHTRRHLTGLITGMAFSCTLLLTACADNAQPDGTRGDSTGRNGGDSADKVNALKPKGEKPAWAPDGIDDEMAVVLEKLASYGAPPIETLTPEEARHQPTPADATRSVMQDYGIPMPPPACDTMGKDIPVQGGMVHARIYTPKGAADSSLPVIVYFHGGGWVIADLNTYDASAKGLCEGTGSVVVSVHYRQGPEHKFPSAHNDAFAAYQWVLNNAASIKGNPKKVAVAGESAGGNLAINVSMMARDKGVQLPVHQLLVYPVASKDMNSESYLKYANAKPLNKPMMQWFAKHYIGDTAKAADPRIDLVNANLKGLPSTTIIGAEIDPLATEGRLLSDRLKAAGVEVDYKFYADVTHEFFGMATVVPDAKAAQTAAGANLVAAFKK